MEDKILKKLRGIREPFFAKWLWWLCWVELGFCAGFFLPSYQELFCAAMQLMCCCLLLRLGRWERRFRRSCVWAAASAAVLLVFALELAVGWLYRLYFLLTLFSLMQLKEFSQGCEMILISRSMGLSKCWGWLWKVPFVYMMTLAVGLVPMVVRTAVIPEWFWRVWVIGLAAMAAVLPAAKIVLLFLMAGVFRRAVREAETAEA